MPDEMIIKTAEGNLVDEVYSSPVDEWQHRVRGLALIAVLAVIVLIAIYLLWYFGRDHTQRVLRYSGAFQIRIHRKRAGRIDFQSGRRRTSALSGLQDTAESLPGQVARRICLVRARVRAESRHADRCFAALAAGHGAGGPQLRGMPYGNGAGNAEQPAHDRAGHARAPTGS